MTEDDWERAVGTAKEWARSRGPDWRRDGYRTPELIRPLDLKQYETIFDPSQLDLAVVLSLVDRVLATRERLTASFRSAKDIGDEIGRILVHNIGETTYSCTPKEMTSGFFDDLDIPPWDLWIGLWQHRDESRLLAWVPMELVSLVDLGVRSSAEENIAWAD